MKATNIGLFGVAFSVNHTLKVLAITLFLSTFGTLSAEDENPKFDTLLGYKNVTVTKILPYSIRVVHESGVVTIPASELPAEIREQLGMSGMDTETLKKAERIIREGKEATRILQEVARKNSLIIEGEITQILRNGVFLSYTRQKRAAGFRSLGFVFIECNSAKAVDGQVFKGTVYPLGNGEFTNGTGETVIVKKYTLSADVFLDSIE